MSALISVGLWGWHQSDEWFQFLLAIGIPVILSIIWGVFAVPNDPSRSGRAPVITPGIIRLILELGFFAFATWALYDMKLKQMSLIFGVIVALHYIVSYDRIIWLVSQKNMD
jgi:hypothetical protein